MNRSDSLGLLAFAALAVLVGTAVPLAVVSFPVAARPPAVFVATAGIVLLTVAFVTVYALRRYGEGRVDTPDDARFDTADDRE